ncbi:MAG: hypothetical protein ABI655_04545 [Phenylobacterium sp.]
MTLTDRQWTTLGDLDRKRNGEAVGFMNIADSRRLEELDLAIRSREGWDITDAGVEALRTRAAAPE